MIFHNLSGYDSHLFIKSLGKTKGNIDCIPNNEKKYISFSKSINDYDENGTKKFKYKIRFIDSFMFMSTSLDKLVNNLSATVESNQFNHVKHIIWKRYSTFVAKRRISIRLVQFF